MTSIAQFREDQYPATDELQCITVYIPAGDEFKWLLAGLLRLPALTSSYMTPDSDQADGLAAVWSDAYQQTDWSNCLNVNQTSDNSLIIFADNMHVDIGNALGTVIDPAQRHNFYARQNPAILGQIIDVERYMTNGTWNYRLTLIRTAASGIFIMQTIDPSGPITTVLTQDLYKSAPVEYNYTVTGTFDIIEPGLTKLSFGTSGKNASSSGYLLLITLIELWR